MVKERSDTTVEMTRGQNRVLSSVLALLTPVVALILERLLWGLIQPHVWFLFYPAVFISAWLGGLRIGLISTLLSITLAWFFFRSDGLPVDAAYLFQTGVFFVTGVGFAFFHERLARAVVALAAKKQLDLDIRRTAEALDASERANEELKRLINEKLLFTALVENSSDFIGIADPNGKPTYLNPAGRRLVGLSADSRIDDTQIADYYSPDQRPLALNVIVPSMLERGEWEGETYFRNWTTEQAIPVSDKHFVIRVPETGVILGMGTICRSIAEQKRLERELVESREFLRNVLDSSTEYSIIAKDLERRIVGWNRGAAQIYGYDESEVIGQPSEILHAPEDIASGLVAELHQRARNEGRATGFFRRVRKDRSEFLARVTITRRNDASGNAIGYLIVSHDVTAEQRHVAEQQFLSEVGASMQESLDYRTRVERLTRLAVGFIGDACAIDGVEEEGGVRRLRVVHSEPAKTPLAEAIEQIVPKRPHPLWDVLDTKQPVCFREVTSDVLRSAGLAEEHRQLIESLGVRSAMIVPMIVRGRLAGVLTIASCRPKRRYGPDDVRLAQELAGRGALAMDNAHLYEVAQQAIQARDRVLGVVAHDLRNPLGTILMQTCLLRKDVGSPERDLRRPAEMIERAAQRMNRLIEDLLDVTRMEGGRLALKPAPLAAEQVVFESAEAQKALATSASLEIRVDVQKNIPEVWADRDRLFQVFENLIGNAVKFTEAKGRITLGAASKDRDVLFWIKDTGCGIAATDVPHVFERLWQAKGDPERRGAGLGLPIVKGIVEAHGGRIWLESILGQGTTFYFTIPTAHPIAEQPQPESALHSM